MGRIETKFGAIGYADAGGGEAIPIVFLHGVGSDKRVWLPQLEHFGRTRRAVAFDYPGYGESDFQPDATRDDFAAAIVAALDDLGIRRAHICGLSLGGVVAIAMHQAAAERWASLILADTFAVHPDGAGIRERGLTASRTIGMRAMAEQRADVLIAPGPPAGLREEVIETMAAIRPEAFAVGLDAVWLADQRDRAAAIRVPTLVLCGECDVVTPPALSKELASLIPNSNLVLIQGAGHLANAERPEQFNKAIDRFLAQVETKK